LQLAPTCESLHVPHDPMILHTGCNMKVQLEQNVAGTFLLVAEDGLSIAV
jgi:hypothetical protein